MSSGRDTGALDLCNLLAGPNRELCAGRNHRRGRSAERAEFRSRGWRRFGRIHVRFVARVTALTLCSSITTVLSPSPARRHAVEMMIPMMC